MESRRRRLSPSLHGGFGGGFGIGVIDAGFGAGGGDCYYVRRAVVVPGIGLVSKRQLVCQ